MRVSGLTFIRNGVRLDYPFVEAIRSALPLCDEFIVVVGESNDSTREAVEKIGDKRIRIIDTTWPENISPAYAVLAHQTNAGLLHCTGDWVVYVQGNEVLHEKDHEHFRHLMEKHKDDPNVEGLVLERKTFWGDYRHFLRVYPWRYKYTARIFKPWNGVYSVRDAMAFAVFEKYGRKGRDLRCIDTGADLYRYGHVLSAEAATAKHTEAPHAAPFNFGKFELSGYYKKPKKHLARFSGEHPAVMLERIANHPFELDDNSPNWNAKLSSNAWKRLIETWLYSRFGMPRFRIKRAKLVQALVRKDRDQERW